MDAKCCRLQDSRKADWLARRRPHPDVKAPSGCPAITETPKVSKSSGSRQKNTFDTFDTKRGERQPIAIEVD